MTDNVNLITANVRAYWDRCLTAQRGADEAAFARGEMGAPLVQIAPTADEAADLAAYYAAQAEG